MPGRRKLNGRGPNKRPKNINGVPLTREEWALFAAIQDKLDCTAGYLTARALRQWMDGREL